jgi:hypothetical protein
MIYRTWDPEKTLLVRYIMVTAERRRRWSMA